MPDIYPAEVWPSEIEIVKLDGTSHEATGLPFIAKGVGPTSEPPLEIQYNRAQQRLKTILATWNQGRVVYEGNGKIGVYPIDYTLDDVMLRFEGATDVSLPSEEGGWTVYIDENRQLQIGTFWPLEGSYAPLAFVYRASGGEVTITDARSFMAFRTSREALLWPLVASLDISGGAESSDQIDVTISVVDAAGDGLADRFEVHAWLADAQYGAETATAPSGGVSVQTGTLLDEPTTNKRWRLISDANGQLVLRLTESGAATWYLNAQVCGKIIASDAITFTT